MVACAPLRIDIAQQQRLSGYTQTFESPMRVQLLELLCFALCCVPTSSGRWQKDR